jgi:hypothetical protein
MEQTGRAVVHIDGYEYLTDNATLDRDVVSFTGRMRIRDLTGTRLYDERRLSHRLRRGEWVDWDRP